VRDGQVVKGVRFRDHRIVGDILELAMRYRDEGADELVFYDITASPQGRPRAGHSILRGRRHPLG
jgi:imidazole glycerol-phosphate synthase subunit HisF